MAHKVVWSSAAMADIEAIAEYIEKDSPFYARAVVTKIMSATRQLKQYPFSGRIVPEKMDVSFREIFVFSYRIIYQVNDGFVTVVAVVHGRQHLNALLST